MAACVFHCSHARGWHLSTKVDRPAGSYGAAIVHDGAISRQLQSTDWRHARDARARVRGSNELAVLQATGETCDIVIETNGDIPFWEGQSYGVIPPGTKINARGKEVPLGTRLYSIASSRYGDSFDGKTTTLCVRRATYWDPELGKEDPAKKGICSNFLCDAKPGQEITMTGPTGKVRPLGLRVRARASLGSCSPVHRIA